MPLRIVLGKATPLTGRRDGFSCGRVGQVVSAKIGAFLDAVVCHNLGMAMLLFSSYGASAWLPTYFIRYYGWSPAFTGQVYGLTAAISGALGVVCGGIFADHLAKRGYRDAQMRVALIGRQPFHDVPLRMEMRYWLACAPQGRSAKPHQWRG